jgi:hypothetical protein
LLRFAARGSADLSVGIALGSSSQIALFVPVLVLLSLPIAPVPPICSSGRVRSSRHDQHDAVTLVTNSGRSGWYVGVLPPPSTRPSRSRCTCRRSRLSRVSVLRAIYNMPMKTETITAT